MRVHSALKIRSFGACEPAIRTENINAKLDVVENVIYVHFNETNPYQEMKDRIKSMNLRYSQLDTQYKTKKKQMESKNKSEQ